jgi:type II secretory pathway component PulK
MRNNCRSSGKGFILVTVLLISTLFLTSAVSYAWFARQEMRRVAGEKSAATARSLAISVLREASSWIASDENEYDSRHEMLYSGIVPITLDYGEYSVSVTIIPQDDKLPINGLFLPDGVTIKNEFAYPWAMIWNVLEKEAAAPVALDFLDGDRAIRPGGREEDYFPNRPIGDLSELLWLPEMTPSALYSGDGSVPPADRYFTVYGDSWINVNMAPVEILAVLDPGIDGNTALAIEAFRKENDIRGEADIVKIQGFSSTAATRLKNVINYKSNYFLVRLDVSSPFGRRAFEAALKRGDGGCVVINWRE